MYYTSKQLDSFNANLHQKAFLQYYHLFRYKKQAFHSLCPHEKEFFFSMLELSSDEIGMIDIYGIQEAYEYIFYSIVITYKNHVIDFENSKEKLLPQHVQRNINKDISFFCFYYRIWINQVDLYRDKYIHEVSDCITKRIKDIQRKGLTQEEYAIQEKMCYVLFFFVYYKAKMFFEEFGKNHILFTVKNYTFVATIFTFCHILSRHYFPCFNGDTNVTFNEDNLFENSKDLLESIKELVVSYFNHTKIIKLNGNVGRILFKKDNQKYIMWIKRKKMSIFPNSDVFEVRTFFKCDRDNIKHMAFFEGTKDVKLVKEWFGCI